ncbi:MAG: hypothetical protein ACPGUD_13095 [Parashewanella sp.]
MLNESVTAQDAIRNEANRVIKSLNYETPADRTAVEGVLESLKTVAEAIFPKSSLGRDIWLRIIAVRNNIQAIQIPTRTY